MCGSRTGMIIRGTARIRIVGRFAFSLAAFRFRYLDSDVTLVGILTVGRLDGDGCRAEDSLKLLFEGDRLADT